MATPVRMPINAWDKINGQELIMNCKKHINFRERLTHLEDHFHCQSTPNSQRQSQSQLHQLKQKLLHLALEETNEPALFKRICGAANQAAKQAWNTSCPLLVSPCLFEDLVRAVGEQFQAGNHELYGQAFKIASLSFAL